MANMECSLSGGCAVLHGKARMLQPDISSTVCCHSQALQESTFTQWSMIANLVVLDPCPGWTGITAV